MRLALDAMGGDHGPGPNVLGAVHAALAAADLHVVLVGDTAQLEPLLAAAGPYPADRVSIHHASQVVGMHEKPAEALRAKPDSSIGHCWRLVAGKQADGLVSAGNTGAVVAAGLFTRKFLKCVHRPGIATVMPTAKGRCVILDVGANVYPKARHLVEYAAMGDVYARTLLGIERPTIGLINVGEEEGKGHDVVQEAYTQLKASPLADRFLGNVEGRDVHAGKADVIVTDGFTGNVMLKLSQGLVQFLMDVVGKELLGALSTEREVAKAALGGLMQKFHYSSVGGAPLLGVDGVCIIAHGSSKERAIANALGAAAQNVRVGLNAKIVQELETLPAASDG